MNGKERVRAALEHREPDRVPIGEFGVDHDMVEQIIGRPTYWRSRRRSIQAFWAGRCNEVVAGLKSDLISLIEAVDYDLVPVHLVPHASFPAQDIRQLEPDLYLDGFGQTWGYSAGNDALLLLARPPREVANEEDLVRIFETEIVSRAGFRIADRTGDRYCLELADDSRLELVRHAVGRFGKEKFIFARSFEEGAGGPEPLYFSEFDAASLFFGGPFEDFYLAIAATPQLVKKAFDLWTEINLAMAREFIKAGVDAIMPGGDFASSFGPLISPQAIRQLFLPGMKRLADFAHLHGVYALTHNCGNNWLILEILLEAGLTREEVWQLLSVNKTNLESGLRKLRRKDLIAQVLASGKNKVSEKIEFRRGIG